MIVKNKYFNRDISWLSFNYRVLEEAKDKSLPLFERIKFLAIYSNNLNEFYKVRVASYRSMDELSTKNKKKLDYEPSEILKEINSIVDKQQNDFGDVFNNQILPELEKNNIILVQPKHIDESFRAIIRSFFNDEVRPYVQPLVLLKGIEPFLNDSTIYFAVKLFKKDTKKGTTTKGKSPKYAITKVPAHKLPRFINLATIEDKHYIIFLDDIVRENLDQLYPGFIIDSSAAITTSRDADLHIEDEFSGDFVEKLKKSLKKRKTGLPTRFLYDSSIANDMLAILKQTFKISDDECIPGGRYHNFYDFFSFPNPYSPLLENDYLAPVGHKRVDRHKSLLYAISRRDRGFHFPYQKYDYVIQFINEAAEDQEIAEIKTTQYRVATNSAIVNALIKAARNGKKVTVFVELKARFDEEANLISAKEMKKAGVHIIYSIPGLKVHAKVALALKKSTDKTGQRKGYAFLSTGNFNEKTARIYADHGIMTAHKEIINELNEVFLYLENQNTKFQFKHLLVAQINMPQRFSELIDREISHAKNGQTGYMVLKMNGLEDEKMIDKLYEASQSGVKIDLIVRGICCLVPGKEFSKNITVYRIVDRFLEHARVYYFHNNGKHELFMASADWMKRNLYRRIEVGFPVYEETIKQEIIDILHIQLSDNIKARIVDSQLRNIPKSFNNDKPVRSQIETYHYVRNIHQG